VRGGGAERWDRDGGLPRGTGHGADRVRRPVAPECSSNAGAAEAADLADELPPLPPATIGLPLLVTLSPTAHFSPSSQRG
jgi:hypothetical protein